MKIRWCGHACFLLTTDSGLKILTDPFDETVGYPQPAVAVDVVTVSHDHFDHNAVQLVPGTPKVVSGVGEHELEGVTITGLATYHDEVQGAKRGENTVFTIAADGLRIVHLGDLGHTLNASQIMALRPVNVLLVPVGGHFTIDAQQAKEVVEALNPNVVIPMHFKTEALDFAIVGVEPFLELMGGGERLHSTTLELTARDLPTERRIVVLDYR
ncbi:MAG: MBL fold metallo-hydrolase [bacterium]|jgi:L-ascorbate metabolism protein UlaG (beta-lactamase superfamily)